MRTSIQWHRARAHRIKYVHTQKFYVRVGRTLSHNLNIEVQYQAVLS